MVSKLNLLIENFWNLKREPLKLKINDNYYLHFGSYVFRQVVINDIDGKLRAYRVVNYIINHCDAEKVILMLEEILLEGI